MNKIRRSRSCRLVGIAARIMDRDVGAASASSSRRPDSQSGSRKINDLLRIFITATNAYMRF